MTTPLPVTLDQFKAQLNDDETDEAHDAELTLHLEAATQLIEDFTGPLVTREFTEDIRPSGGRVGQGHRGRVLLSKRPVVDVTSVSLIVYGTVTALDDFDPAAVYLDRSAGVLDLRGWANRNTDFRVTYTAGRGTAEDVESKIKLAVLITGEHLWETQRGRGVRPSRWGTQGNPEDVPEIQRGFALPRRAQELIGHETQVAIG